MTDNEIIKAFRECGQKMNTNYCDECPYNKGMCNDIQMAKDILDLINRLQAEVENMNDLVVYNAICTTKNQQKLFSTKAEAYKEFAERLKERAYLDSGITGFQDLVVDAIDIDNLLKDLVGDNNV